MPISFVRKAYKNIQEAKEKLKQNFEKVFEVEVSGEWWVVSGEQK